MFVSPSTCSSANDEKKTSSSSSSSSSSRRHDGGHVVCAREVSSSGAVAYVLAMKKSSVASTMNGKKVVFVDLPATGSQLMPGRPFAMVEGEQGNVVTLESPVTGEVVEINERLLQEEPELVGGGGDDGWLVRVDPLLDDDDEDPDFATMMEMEMEEEKEEE